MKTFFLYWGIGLALILAYSLLFGPIAWGSYFLGFATVYAYRFTELVGS